MTLGDFLRDAAQDDGPWNCSTMPADWCIRIGHRDFAAEWRDLDDACDCETAPREAGGLVVLWELGIRDDIPRVGPPYAAGDIGVVAFHGLEAGAIFTGDKWAVRTRTGISFARLPVTAIAGAWRP
ncbi:hypothetical protein [Sphingomonas koreensis]